jgi:mycoredoxin
MDTKDTIVVFGAEWCGDCRRSKKFLDANLVSYTYVDVEANPDQIAVMQQYNGGLQSLPTIVFPDGQVLVEPSNPLLAEKLGLR